MSEHQQATPPGAKGDRAALPKSPGRKRDHSLDESILEAAIDILAQKSFDTMTMDMVAARAKTGKATVYRRWSSKAKLVRDALIHMSRHSVELEQLPDTGSLREDLLAVLKPYSKEFAERKLRVLAGLGSFYAKHQELANEVMATIFESWTSVNRRLMQQAAERGEISPQANIEIACRVIVSMASNSHNQQIAFDRAQYAALLDNILLPALRHSQGPA